MQESNGVDIQIHLGVSSNAIKKDRPACVTKWDMHYQRI